MEITIIKNIITKGDKLDIDIFKNELYIFYI